MSHSRKRVLVDQSVQGALAKRICFHWVVFFLLSLLCLFSLEYFLGDPTLTLGGHLSVLWNKYGFFLLLMVAIIPSFVYDTLKLSNRFAGPMIRIKQSIRKLADGEAVSELKFRDGDFWCDVSDDFNRMVQRVNQNQENPA
ncbi:MAG: hypothetical protein NXI32_22085 [bacterium]|nr:hypothetical protein [bacterium]